jgi:hypothetical protein
VPPDVGVALQTRMVQNQDVTRPYIERAI